MYCACWCFVCVIWLLVGGFALGVCWLGLAPQGWILVSLRFDLYCLVWWCFGDFCVDFKLWFAFVAGCGICCDCLLLGCVNCVCVFMIAVWILLVGDTWLSSCCGWIVVAGVWGLVYCVV